MVYINYPFSLFTCVFFFPGKKTLPPGAVSKEEHIKVDALRTFDSSHHVPGSSADSVAYLRNISFSTNYLNTPDRALEFPGNIQSYMYIPNPKGDFSGIDMGAWFFYIYPDSQMSHGCILEYEGNCPGGTGLSIRFKNKKIEVKARQSNGKELYGISKTEIPFGQWSYVGVMWHVVYPEIRVIFVICRGLLIMSVNQSKLDQTLLSLCGFLSKICPAALLAIQDGC